ncbi:RNA polymerase sigma factor [Corallococcus sp. bb12-1]|uniref:RNA polymerase sigma factor n=1 Tax=Corallococcus sp. bb12-1 TaxID=2996784 RepID=UPI003B641704
MTEQELAECIRRAVRGEQPACGELYQRFHASVRRVAQGYAELGTAEVEDVVQETFVRAFRELPRLQHPRAFSGWLLTIARHHAFALSRGARARERVAEGLAREAEVSAPALPPSLTLERRVAVVRALIEGLPEGPEKETARLFYLEGELSAREIAERLGLGKSAVTMRLERFRARVKRELMARLLAAEVG